MSDYKLLPCPFCRSEIIHAEIYSPLEEFRIYCAGGDGCLAEMRLAFSDAGVVGKRLDFDKAKNVMDEMVELWNTRAQLSRQKGD